jgi:hypothetical protein
MGTLVYFYLFIYLFIYLLLIDAVAIRKKDNTEKANTVLSGMSQEF